MSKLSTVFPEINTEEWMLERQRRWDALLSLDSESIGKMRKKQLDTLQEYFFKGNFSHCDELKLLPGACIKYFPIQNEAGYGYLFSQFGTVEKFDYLKRMLVSNALEQGSECVRTPLESKEYFEFFMGELFSPSPRVFFVSDGEIEVSLTAESVARSLTGFFFRSLRENYIDGISGSWFPVLLDYYLSIFAYVSDYESHNLMRSFSRLFKYLNVYNSERENYAYYHSDSLKFVDDLVYELEKESSIFPVEVTSLWHEVKNKSL